MSHRQLCRSCVLPMSSEAFLLLSRGVAFDKSKSEYEAHLFNVGVAAKFLNSH